MAITKTATVTIRVDPSLKEALRTAAKAEHRSISNMLEMMIRDHCKKAGIAIEKSQGLEHSEGHLK